MRYTQILRKKVELLAGKAVIGSKKLRTFVQRIINIIYGKGQETARSESEVHPEGTGNNAQDNRKDESGSEESSDAELMFRDDDDVEGVDLGSYSGGARGFDETVTDGLLQAAAANASDLETRVEAMRSLGGNLASSILPASIKTGTGFSRKLTVAMDLGSRETGLECGDELAQRMLLCRCACVFGRVAIGGHSSYVAHSDAGGIMARSVGSRQRLGTASMHAAVAVNHPVVANVFEAALQMPLANLRHREVFALGRGGAVNNNFINRSHHCCFLKCC